ncbi:LamG domain-containing protein [Candidatus Parcubacteria bacterium]|nr:MAG: LamG domain-containing protein [Candidatus Parcubacteria bacterium]
MIAKVKNLTILLFGLALILGIFSEGLYDNVEAYKAKTAQQDPTSSPQSLVPPSNPFYKRTSNDITAYLGRKDSKLPYVRYQKDDNYLQFEMQGAVLPLLNRRGIEGEVDSIKTTSSPSFSWQGEGAKNLPGQAGLIPISSTTAVTLETTERNPNTPTLYYRNAFKDTDITYKITNIPFTVKEEIVIREPYNSQPVAQENQNKKLQVKSYKLQDSLSFLFSAHTNAIPSKQQDGSIYFYDSRTNEYLFQLDKPFMYDAKGIISNDVRIDIIPTQNSKLRTQNYNSKFKNNSQFSITNFQSIINDLTLPTGRQGFKQSTKLSQMFSNVFSSLKIENCKFNENCKLKIENSPKEYQILLQADSQWLNSPDRVYPVTIDPTITHNADANFSGEKNRIADSDTTSSTQLESSYPEATKDPHTVLLLQFNEANGSTNIKDYASTTRVITANGNASTTNYVTRLGMGNSLALDGTGDYLSTTDAVFAIGSSDFTIESWVYFNSLDSVSGNHIAQIDGAATNFLIANDTNNKARFLVRNDAGVNLADLYSPSAWTTGKWYHVVGIVNNGTAQLFIDGTLQSSALITGVRTQTGTNLLVGVNTGGASRFVNGYLDSLRILKGRALTPEEIKAAASRRPYAVYTSPVLDASASVQWDTLNWTEGGVTTGNGEQPYSTNSLVAQWDFNDTSGTTLTASSSGSCTTSCNGTLNGFSYTTSQDQATTTTGWTANNKRWGTGALMFDGVNDSVSVNNGAVTLSGFTSFTATMWIRQSSVLADVSTLVSNDLSGNQPYTAYINTSRQPYWYLNTSGGTFNVTSPTALTLGEWNFLSFTYDGVRMYIYINGALATSTVATGTMDAAANAAMRIGMRSDGSLPFSGLIDSTRIYSRALSASEILSNYQAGNIEIQTRTGATSDPNDGTWEAWKPTTGETQLLSMDSDQSNWNAPQQIDGYTKLLLHMDGVNAATTFPNSATTTHTVTRSGDAQVSTAQSKFGGGSGLFDGTGDYLSVADSDDWNFGSGDFTIDFWINFNSISSHSGIFMQSVTTDVDQLYFYRNSGGASLGFLVYGGGVSLANYGVSWTPVLGTWYHFALVRSGSNFNIYVNGKALSLTETTAISTLPNYAAPFLIADANANGTVPPLNGRMDEFRISKGIARWTSNFTPPPRPYGSNVKAENETTIKQEGTASTKLTLGAPQIDGNTVALWHFEETGTTTGTYLYDETANNNDATTTTATTRPVDGIFGKARYMSSQSDFLSLSPSTNIPTGTSARSVDFWAKPIPSAMTSGAGYVFGYGAGVSNQGFGVSANGGNWWFQGYSAGDLNSNKSVIEGKWTHIAVTYDGTTLSIYVDGLLANSATKSLNTTASAFFIGQAPWDTNNRFVGAIDELRVSNRALSADEIAETYRMGANHHLTRQISSTDLSSANKLAFNIAADRPGTYLEAMIGESDHANYELASSTLALSTTTVLYIKGDEIASSTSIKDSSFSGKAITANGNARISGVGKIGNSVYFDGTGDYLSLADSDDWAFGTGDFSIDTWLKYDSVSGDLGIYGHGASNGFFIYSRSSDETINVVVDAGGTLVFSAKWTPVANKWYHLALTRSGNNWGWFINGNKIGGTSNSSTVGNYSGTANIGSAPGGGGNYFPGSIDEIRILKGTALTADQIRQAYEYGLRSHPITIDFGATLQPSDLISSASDYNFSLTATTSGLSATTSGLYLGDKIIVKENRSGTEYTAQGTVNAINTSTGAITVPAWDSGSSFPSGGFTQYATVFKWQREYFDLTGAATTTRNAITNFTIRPINNAESRTIYLDDFKYNTNYLTASSSSAITSSNGRYLQYRVIFSSWDSFVSPFLSSLSTAYTSLTNMFAPGVGVSGGGILMF